MKKIELLAPAGDLNRLKLALIYGADAVYIGGKEFSLRSHASNFSLKDIKKGVDFAHKLEKKVYVTCNIIMHNDNLNNLEKYLKKLDNIKVDGIITSSLAMIKLIKSQTRMEAHLSTQISCLNSEVINFFSRYNIDRVVLARECSLNDIKQITKLSEKEIEVFIHGGMCSSYSGKCMLSNVMTRRDANRGGCAHSCRWKYDFVKNGKVISKENEYFSFASKDLCALDYIVDLIQAGVSSLKIEGRMKSANYLCAIISSYRHLIDDYYNHQSLDMKLYHNLMSLGENRHVGKGFFEGNVTIKEQELILSDKFVNAGDFIGIVKSYNKNKKLATIELKNKIINNASYLLLTPKQNPQIIKISRIIYQNQEYEQYTIANHLIRIKCDTTLKPYDIIHKLINFE